MSALTKVFVVLLVVVSLLMVSGLVVFVNKVEDYQGLTKQANAKADLERRAKEAEIVKSQMIIGEKELAAVEAMNRAGALASVNQSQLEKISQLTGQIAAAQADKKLVDSQVTTLTAAIDEQQKTNGAMEKVIADLRSQRDELDKKYNESQVALSDLNNRLDAQNRDKNYLQENVTALETENANLRKQLVNMPVHGAAAPGAGGASAVPVGYSPVTPQSSQPIRGVVKSKFRVGDVSYATVSVGSADSVSKGTRFNVTDPTGKQFLGYLTIDSVNPNEASGHLAGPNVNAITQGSEVMSNWQ